MPSESDSESNSLADVASEKTAPKYPKVRGVLLPAREAQGLTQAAAGQAIGVDANHYARIEKGLSRPPLKRRALLAKALKLEPQEVERAFDVVPQAVIGIRSVVRDDDDQASAFERVRREPEYLNASPTVQRAYDRLPKKLTSSKVGEDSVVAWSKRLIGLIAADELGVLSEDDAEPAGAREETTEEKRD